MTAIDSLLSGELCAPSSPAGSFSATAGKIRTALIEADTLAVDQSRREIRLADKVLRLKPKEFDLLLFLARHAGQVFSREQLMNAVWDYDFAGDSGTVTVHMRRLREKVEEDPSRPR
mgnify:CR=1 FL=1